MKHALTHTAMTVVAILVLSQNTSAEPLHLHVAVDGNDRWSGQLQAPNAAKTDGPLATLTGAHDTIRRRRQAHDIPAGGVEVVIHGGTYAIQQTLQLTAQDSGTHDSPITYRAASGPRARLLGGKVVSNWKRVTDPQVLDRLDPAARGQVMQADLTALGVTDFGSPAGGGIELFFEGKPMAISRWPNEGFVSIVDVLGQTERDVRGTKGCAEGILQYEGDRPERWVDETETWVHGYWFWDWSEQRHQIKRIDLKRHVMEVQPPYHNYGYRKGQWFYAFNLLSEIDRAGEWYVDRARGILYFWPPSSAEEGEAIVSVLPTLVTLENVSHVTLRDLTMEGLRGTAITVSGGTDVRVVGCTIRNVGGWAVTVSGGRRHGVIGCDMQQMGGGGISLSGGDRMQLEPAGHVAENNHIHHFARVKRVYQPGITLQGVGHRAAHNLIHNAPHMGIGFGGNEHVIELNEMHSVCYESNDAGAIYAGRNWTMRGTVIRHNYLHHINGFRGKGCVGIYLDDMLGGTTISGNLFFRVTRAAFIGGGRDNLVENNLFVDCQPALHIDARALGWAKYHAEMWIKEGHDKGTLSGIRYKEPPYRERYPRLARILDEEPAAPRGNRVVHNVSFGGRWDGVYNEARPYQTIADNLVDQDPRFARPDPVWSGQTPRAVDFSLHDQSPAWEIGFQKLPLDQIGLVDDENRATWPVVHHVR